MRKTPQIMGGGKLPPQAVELEEAVLGAIMIEKDAINSVLDILKPDSFYKEAHSIIFSAIIDLYSKNEPIDILTVTSALRGLGKLEYVGGAFHVTELTSKVSSAANLEFHARIIVEQAMKRKLIAIGSELSKRGFEETTDAFELMNFIETSVIDMNSTLVSGKSRYVKEYFNEAVQMIKNASKSADGLTGVPTGIKTLDQLTGGWQKTDLIVVGARPSMGKAQGTDNQILTPNGFVKIGSIKVGDKIIGSDGKTQFVTGVFPQGVKDLYEISFGDGTKTKSCIDHLWLTKSRNERKGKKSASVKSLKQIIDSGIRVNKDQRLNHSVQYISPVEFEEKEFKIHPYVLGFCIGDMNISGLSVSNPEKDIIEKCRSLLSISKTIITDRKKAACDTYGFCDDGSNEFLFRNELKRLGLDKSKSFNKFIPKEYLHGSLDQRIELLRGLVDTDGYVVKGSESCIEYSTTSKMLCDDITYLVRSLGGRCTNSKLMGSYTIDGKSKKTRHYYRMNLSFTNEVVPVSSEKHLSRYRKPKNNLEKFINSIEYSSTEECVCISVSNEDQLYITDDFIVTHNTDFAINLAVNAAKADKKVAVYSLEMGAIQNVQRMIAIDREIGRTEIRKGDLTESDWGSLSKFSSKIMNNIVLMDEPNVNHLTIRSGARKFHLKEKLGLIIIDYVQLIDSSSKSGSKNDQIGEISRALKLMAKELDIPVIVLSQLSRAVETRGGDKRPKLSDLRDSGAIEADADVVIFPYRPEYYGFTEDEDGNSTAQLMELDVAKHRNGALDTIKTRYKGKFGKITDWDMVEIQPSSPTDIYRTDKFHSDGADDFDLKF